jgi:hypothetical protein
MQKHTIYHTIAHRNPRGAYNFLAENGYKNMKKDPTVIQAALAEYALKHQDSALPKLAELHPDKELFEKEKDTEKIQPEQHNADAESERYDEIRSCDGCKMKSADGDCPFKNADAPKETGRKFSLSDKTVNRLIVVGGLVFVVASLAIIIRKTK